MLAQNQAESKIRSAQVHAKIVFTSVMPTPYPSLGPGQFP